MLLAPTTRLGCYEIVALLGTGVWAKCIGRGTRDCIGRWPSKFSRLPEIRKRFEREARAISSLNHPNVCTLYDVGYQDGVEYLVMEYLEGETLRSRLRRSVLGWRKATEIAIEVAEGSAAAHRKGVTHRDLKPENIFITADGRIKILDFGLARGEERRQSGTGSSNEGSMTASISQAGIVLGTPGYMSPEQVRGQAADARSDIFALGCILYEMIAGEQAFARGTFAQSMAAVLEHQPTNLSEIGKECPPGLELIITNCMAKRPEERFESARDIALALRAVLVTSSAVTKRPNRHLNAKFAIPIVFLLLVVVAFLWHRHYNVKPAIDALAVLPFVNAGADPASEYLSDGVTETLISTLSQTPGLTVMSSNSVFRLKGKEIDPQQAGRTLNVDAVLIGRVAERGGSLQMDVELVEVASNRQIWGSQYKGSPADILSMQDAIAGAVAQQVGLGAGNKKNESVGAIRRIQRLTAPTCTVATTTIK